ncbi:unnamed protein product [Arctogadus glacialis]
MESSCLDLALEGERLCKAGDYRTGVPFFESAIQVGTEDLQILSAIYSQLGNAYFHQQEYPKALEYHSHDLTLTRTIGDELGEAKASGNLGNTLKLLGRFDEAGVCCQRHLDITRAMYDRVGQARALYNFGNVYHAKGKSICWIRAEPGEFPEDARSALKKATQFYEPDAARPPTHPHRPTQAGGTSGRQLTPPSPGTADEVRHGHLHPRPVHDPEVEGLQREVPPGNPPVDILHAVEPLEGGVVGIEGKRATQQVVTKGADRPSDAFSTLLYPPGLIV